MDDVEKNKGGAAASCSTKLPPTIVTPRVKWAQRENLVFLTICVCEPVVDLVMVDEDDGRNVFFRARDLSNTVYQLDLDLFDNVEPEFKQAPHNRGFELILTKKVFKLQVPRWWPRLQLADGKKSSWFIGPDFTKWVDEDKRKYKQLLEYHLGFKKPQRKDLDAIFGGPPGGDKIDPGFDPESEQFRQLVEQKRAELRKKDET